MTTDQNAQQSLCQRCLYYDFDEENGQDGCMLYLDEDEAAALYSRKPARCPYVRDYDEYKTVRKQN